MSNTELESYAIKNGRVTRDLRLGDDVWRSEIDNLADDGAGGHAAWWQSFLRGAQIRSEGSSDLPPIRTVDAFCGCGGLTLGAAQAILAAGRKFEAVAAIDVDEGGLQVHRANFGTKHILHTSASSLVDFHVSGIASDARFAYEPEIIDEALVGEVGKIDLFLAGPPCQGHSNLNNRTRREDPRNLLYLTAVALAIGLKARMVVIENVPDVVNDKSGVVVSAKALLKACGYKFIDSGVLAANDMGWAQTRKRYFLIAAKVAPRKHSLTLNAVSAGLKRDALNLGWAIGDLMREKAADSSTSVMDTVPALSEENRSRISWLFANDKHELPNHERPDCHKDGHSYPSVYGRMFWEKPAQTITTGFLTPGRGRYIHPLQPRVITPHEAARIQAFPDSFRFVVNGHDPARAAISKWIGDAVPPVLGYAAMLPLLALENTSQRTWIG
ncbi:DNA cytosine methyltransferase [Pseudoluteimonas lycopersici]|uniref:DNA (cytosine-5-)-methyltransferase n=1 Tax=Pseudoluteimonas lycopersici TaxID=1324796 RepID=A0A516V5L1_9GAMM|nr:DNA cytosine methyltransferase [Lysobacter lycopersici]QDQ73781.1 DNA cytosine methyltransferase [Lysobacter lycopersici]